MNKDKKDLSIYIHWPFCKSKCPYCDFFSQVNRNINQDDIISEYLNQLQKYADILKDRSIISVFFGGGTPSLIKPSNINLILQKIDSLWGINQHCEISLEANPNTQTPSLFADLAKAGINRLSLGIQSLDDKQLKFLGRTHNSIQAIYAIEDVLKNFTNHSVDLMYALPEQTTEQWQNQLEKITAFGLKHISLYQLTIEENTLFYRRGIKPSDEENAIQMYRFTEDFLSPLNYHKYEVSNYSLPNFQSVHNQTYWNGGDYIGIGKSAHGRLKLNNKLYAQTDPIQLEELTKQERAEELIIMGLRLTSGINKQHFQNICGLQFDTFINQDFKQQAIKQNLLYNTPEYLCATPDGFLLLNYLIEGLCC